MMASMSCFPLGESGEIKSPAPQLRHTAFVLMKKSGMINSQAGHQKIPTTTKITKSTKPSTSAAIPVCLGLPTVKHFVHSFVAIPGFYLALGVIGDRSARLHAFFCTPKRCLNAPKACLGTAHSGGANA